MGNSTSKSTSRQDDWLLSTKSALLSSYSEQTNGLWWKPRLPSFCRRVTDRKSPEKDLSRAGTLKPVKEFEERDLWWEEERNETIRRNHQAAKMIGSVSFHIPPKQELESSFAFSRKSFKEGNPEGEHLIGRRKLTYPTSELASSPEGLDMNIGLRMLLSPVRGSRLKMSPSLNRGNRRFQFRHDRPSVSGSTVNDDEGDQWSYGEEACTPSFDASLLATFERAIEAVSDVGWGTSDLTTSENVSSSSDTWSDADSPELQVNADIYTGTPNANNVPEMGNERLALYLRKLPFSRLFPLHTELKAQDYLNMFERRCPAGCENKIVLYFTTLRVIRKTFEDCSILRLIMKGFQVHVDERDVSMHSKFREELTNVMGAAVSVPRLFIMGRHIGSTAEVELLHEEGILTKLVEGLPVDCKQMCDVCGDVRFIACTTCSGSCKLLLEDFVERCPDCNENGLIMCSVCAW